MMMKKNENRELTVMDAELTEAPEKKQPKIGRAHV